MSVGGSEAGGKWSTGANGAVLEGDRPGGLSLPQNKRAYGSEVLGFYKHFAAWLMP